MNWHSMCLYTKIPRVLISILSPCWMGCQEECSCRAPSAEIPNPGKQQLEDIWALCTKPLSFSSQWPQSKPCKLELKYFTVLRRTIPLPWMELVTVTAQTAVLPTWKKSGTHCSFIRFIEHRPDMMNTTEQAMISKEKSHLGRRKGIKWWHFILSVLTIIPVLWSSSMRKNKTT